MLRPQDTSTRETKRLDGIWGFASDRSGETISDAAAHALRRRWLSAHSHGPSSA